MVIAFAREGADVLISYLNEDEGARDTARLVEEAGCEVVLVPGDIRDAAHSRSIVARAVEAFGRLDILVNNAAFQMTRESLDEISDEAWRRTFDRNISAMLPDLERDVRGPLGAAGYSRAVIAALGAV